MRNKQIIYMIELEQEQKITDQNNYQEFIKNFQTTILLSLLENKQLTKWQFDFCADEISKQFINSVNTDM